ncbi:MAG: DNA repair protein RecO [Alphaproteobacteria bacterium]|nr:MAG: DNA repair protein RecO [Alphaproteobacteria bacterium]
MDWQDHGLVIGVRPFGETSGVAICLTEHHGRHSGLVRGIAGRRQRGVWQPGNRLALVWSARLDDQLGSWRGEVEVAHAATALSDANALAVLSAATAILDATVPDRAPHPDLFAATDALLSLGPNPGLGQAYVQWELGLLASLGFGLNLSRCAISGVSAGLAFVSPRTGRAVSAAAAGPWRDRLLPLPRFLGEPEATVGPPEAAEVMAALALTGHFLDRALLMPSRGIPAARSRLLDRLGSAATGG